MKLPVFAAIALFSSPFVIAQTSSPALLTPGTTLPIRFDHSIDANHVHTGDAISAKTTQQVRLANGQTLPAGAHVIGHVTTASAFSFDTTPYAKQKQSTLTIHFDSIDAKNEHLPLNVYVRAMADPITSWDARRPKPSDEDPLGTLTQIGGDQLTPSQKEILSQEGDIVGYQHHGGAYAHLISATGNAPSSCDATDTEQSMGLYSASACGLYGFTNVSLLENGRAGNASILTLVSHRDSPKIWANSTALLEVLSHGPAVVSQ